jgi:hypothetical protein
MLWPPHLSWFFRPNYNHCPPFNAQMTVVYWLQVIAARPPDMATVALAAQSNSFGSRHVAPSQAATAVLGVGSQQADNDLEGAIRRHDGRYSLQGPVEVSMVADVVVLWSTKHLMDAFGQYVRYLKRHYLTGKCLHAGAASLGTAGKVAHKLGFPRCDTTATLHTIIMYAQGIELTRHSPKEIKMWNLQYKSLSSCSECVYHFITLMREEPSVVPAPTLGGTVCCCPAHSLAPCYQLGSPWPHFWKGLQRACWFGYHPIVHPVV